MAKIGTVLMANGASAEVVRTRFTKIGTVLRANGASAEVVMPKSGLVGKGAGGKQVGPRVKLRPGRAESEASTSPGDSGAHKEARSGFGVRGALVPTHGRTEPSSLDFYRARFFPDKVCVQKPL